MTESKSGAPTVRVQAIGRKTTCRSCGAPIVEIQAVGKARKEKQENEK